jgi:hypothetical protein
MNREIIVRQATGPEINAWDDLVGSFDNARVFHTKAWISSIEAFSGEKALYLVWQKGTAVVGCLPGFLVRIGFLRVFGSPLEGWQTDSMGPAFRRESVSTDELIASLVSFLEKNYGVHQIELSSPSLDADAMKRLGFRGQCLFTYRIPLFPGDKDRVMRNINPKTRTQLRKAIKLGLVVKLNADETFIDESYAQIREVFTRKGKSLPYSKKRLSQCVRYAAAGGNLLPISILLPDESTSIATGIFLIDGKELYFWQWAHRTEYRWYCPSELLMWTAMQKGMEAGCVTFDMSGGGRAKIKFGAVPDDNNHRWIRSRYEWLAALRDLARAGYRWQQRARGRFYNFKSRAF